MDRRIGLAIAVIIGAVLVGVGAYQAGLAQGVAQGLATTGQGAQAALPYGYWYHPFGFGFGFLGFLLPLAFIFLLFAAFRGGRGGSWGPRTGMLDDWHRRAHDEGERARRGSPASSERQQP